MIRPPRLANASLVLRKLNIPPLKLSVKGCFLALQLTTTLGSCQIKIDQPKANKIQQAIVVVIRVGGRSLPIAGRVKETEGAIGFHEQKAALDYGLRWGIEAAPLSQTYRLCSEKGDSQPNLVLKTGTATHLNLPAGHPRTIDALVGFDATALSAAAGFNRPRIGRSSRRWHIWSD